MTTGMTADGDLADVSTAVITRIASVPELAGFELFDFPKLDHPIPAGLIKPDPGKDRDYMGTFSGLTRYFLRLEFHVDAADETGAWYREMALLVSKRGPVVARLRDDDVRDDLWDLCGLDIGLTDGRNWRINRRKRLQADIGLWLGAN